MTNDFGLVFIDFNLDFTINSVESDAFSSFKQHVTNT